ncbi:hypothetical protein Q3V94_12745 [Caloramator sp. CAR-1]|uniref:hypothetical protein n=1 Tax=Caloramator sp. CAR-1 TaxID=3062777 RepID=UPI0026E13D06|nr:hypothetical protein [Caloramator sp. CAR-1]MDO6355923.1 hypothetical protein [Caloramator sp. CAR-1]
MTNKRSYSRYFIIFQEDDRGFGIAIDRPPTGYAKIENKNGRAKINFYVQNLLQEKGPYTACLIDATKNPPVLAKLGEINVDETGRGEVWWEYREDDIADTGIHIDRFNVACIMAEDQYPLSGQIGKERIEWKERLKNPVRQEDKEEELDEEAKKFIEYEERIKNEIEKIKEGEKVEEKDEVKVEEEENPRQLKGGAFAKVFHRILKDLEEVKLSTEFKNTRWWKVPLERPDFEPKLMPYYCIIYHLIFAYPYINYFIWMRRTGYYYFGLKYDDEGEIEYVVYGIIGENTKKDQPFFGATGFKKWIEVDGRGMWIMIYNPWTGMVMVP